MGTFRVLLALLVMAHHYGTAPMIGFGLGWVADAAFIILAGYTASYVLTDRSQLSSLEYAKQRIINVAVPYYFWLLIAIGVSFFSTSAELSCEAAIPTVYLSNLLIVPRVFGFTNEAIIGCSYLPQAWFLGFLVPCYIIFPYLIRRGSADLLIAIFFVSLGVAALGYYHVMYPFRLGLFWFPSGLYLFILGVFSHRFYSSKIGSRQYGFLAGIVLFVLATSLTLSTNELDVNREVLVGVILTLAVIHRYHNKAYSDSDVLLGKLALGVFLSHYTVMVALLASPIKGVLLIFTHVLLTMILGLASIYSIEILMKKDRSFWRTVMQ